MRNTDQTDRHISSAQRTSALSFGIITTADAAMIDGTILTTRAQSGLPAAGKARCPHLLYHNIMGTETVAALLDYARARERDFMPGVVRNRQSGQQRVDRAVRDCYRLTNLGEFRTPFCALLDRITVQALRELQLFEPAVEASEFEMCAYRDGGHFAPHIDTFETFDRVRILSCVYYFAPTPRRFSGGILRLHGFPTSSAKSGTQLQTLDIMPETNSLVIFPSWLRHEVLPVEVPSRAWTDGRFTINCWIHRVSSPTDAVPIMDQTGIDQPRLFQTQDWRPCQEHLLGPFRR